MMDGITAEKAHQLEMTFTGRFDQAFGRLTRIWAPVDSRWVDRSRVNIYHSQDASLLPRQAATVARYGAPRRVLPRNSASVYHVSAKSGASGAFAVGALCYSHIAAYSQHGVDTAPISLGELTAILERGVELGRSRNILYILGIASPTGWEPVAEEAIAGSPTTRGFIDPHLAVCLVDPSSNALAFNPGDPRITHFLDLFIGELEEEAVLRVVEHVCRELLFHDSLSSTEVIKATGVPFQVVHQAFTRLAAGGAPVIVQTQESGLVLRRLR
jgi:hypothetical protein